MAGLVGVRAQMQALHAVEATLLTLGDALAGEVAERERHSDHGECAHRALAAEFAAAVRESDRTMSGRIARAAALVNDYPDVLHSLQTGEISHTHAAVITEAGTVITDRAARDQYAAAVLEIARRETPGRLRPLARELAERFTDRTLDERHAEARTCRMVRVVELEDGMADLTATLPAVYAFGIKDRLNQMARAVQQHERAQVRDAARGVDSPGGSSGSDVPVPAVRSMDQIRADLLTDLLLASDPHRAAASGHTGLSGIHARVQVIVPKSRVAPPDGPPARGPGDGGARDGGSRNPTAAPTAVARPTLPASLAGYGPIDTRTARQLAGNAAHWEAVSMNPDTGAVLSVDTYRPNAQLRQFLRARDLHCRFPGCHTPTSRCDIDHTIDAALGGPTTSTNLAHLCRRHHTLKHHSRWRVRQQEDGTLIWTSPLGAHHTERPPSTVRFGPVPAPARTPEPARAPHPGRGPTRDDAKGRPDQTAADPPTPF